MLGYQLNSDSGQAYSTAMEDEGFRTVSVPDDTQLQLGSPASKDFARHLSFSLSINRNGGIANTFASRSQSRVTAQGSSSMALIISRPYG